MASVDSIGPISNEEILTEMEANKALFASQFGGSEEKINAYRRQSLILDQITEKALEGDHQEVFRPPKIDDDAAFTAYVKDRHMNVDNLLYALPPGVISTHPSVEEFRKERQSILEFEIETSGRYKSQIKEEVNEADLKMFQNILGEVPSINLLKPPPFKRFETNSELEIPTTSRRSTGEQSSRRSSHEHKPSFRTAREELAIQNAKRHSEPGNSSALFNYGASRRSLGARRSVRSSFVPPIRSEDQAQRGSNTQNANQAQAEPIDERLQNIDPKMVELITNEIMHKFEPIAWDDIAGLDYAKSTIKEAVVWPLLRPDIFTGLRRPPRGILLFGPPGTGKTLIGKCIASQSKSTFFSISASSLTSKWVGDGEKMVRALFAVAAVHQPSVVFIDEIDSLLSRRSDTEHESSRRIKTEFLVQLDGATTDSEDRILIIGATNRPQELDEAARRRLVRRLYIPLPELEARKLILMKLLQSVSNMLSDEQIEEIGKLTEGYSGADVETLCREASMEPIRSIPPDDISIFNEAEVRPVTLDDFKLALQRVRASVSQNDLQHYADWNKTYGAGE